VNCHEQLLAHSDDDDDDDINSYDDDDDDFDDDDSNTLPCLRLGNIFVLSNGNVLSIVSSNDSVTGISFAERSEYFFSKPCQC
jgi:hypothetical protein